MSVTSAEIPYFSGPIVGDLPSIPVGRTVLGQVVIPISGPDFEYQLDARIVAEELNRDTFRGTFAVDENVDFILTIKSNQIERRTTVESGQFSLNYRITKPTARAHFVATTLMAAFALAGGVRLRIPELEIDQRLNIAVPLRDISQLLQSRQGAYRFMVVGKAVSREFLLPPTIPSKDKQALTFAYHAIVDRSFLWHSGEHQVTLPAIESSLAGLPSDQPFRFPHPVDGLSSNVLGHTIELGPTLITIEGAVIKNLEAVRAELGRNDGHLVTFKIESLGEQGRYEFLEAPCLPKNPWDVKIQGLVDLDAQLDAALLANYNELVAATLEGLTDKQKAAVTARPDLGEEAFSI
jgi:hypothetical protein